ncbi:ferrochelatase-2, chloroplastic isoform X1 [Cryptomeria japonica]|uniref:ferrochelatase-2, chloroplastic isoform X1 n=1 Tax=Cryptomeria japonica TaxID=3369 RepID=UPI0027DA68EC|nr:ferrochelatase-2, chloroplastic isoform X1 [Cryptomeria japonica]XP_059065156.1 ferrochelatase-2, chloroplastic isoform X1 [Cryptomeria japonica]
MEAVAFCSSVPVMQRDRLSSSFQASTRGSLQFGISEANISSFAVQKTICARSCLKTHISTDSEGLVRKSSLYNRRIIHTASCKLHLSRNDLTSRNQLQWKPFLYRTIKKTEFVDNNFISSRALPLAENIEVAPASDAVSDAGVDQDRVGVLLLNLGGPDTLDDVQPFLFNLFSDPDIIRLPRFFRFLQQPLAKFISVFRAPKSREGYAAIGGGSPLRKITYEQADALRLALEGKKTPAKVYVGMRYWYPFTEEAIEQIKRDKVTKLVVLPLYPQYSISTSGSSIRLLQSLFREDDYLIRLQHVIIASWYEREGYIQVMANLIEKELQSFVCAEKVMIFFSAHGVPVTYVENAGDPYKTQMEECVALIMEELKQRGIYNEHTLAYQSRVGPVEWLKPYTDETIIELGQRGVKSLLAVPISFVSEHIETLEEIDMEYKELALESGIENWGRVPALGSEPAFISDLADAVIEALPNVKTMA